MDLERLREFVVIGKSTSISSAAEVLNLVPSTLSKHVMSMESELDVQLLDRSSTGVRLSPAGRRLVGWATETLGSYEGLLGELDQLKQEEAATVTIGGDMFNYNVFNAIEMVVAKSMRKQLPVTVQVSETYGARSMTIVDLHEPFDGLMDGSIDIALVVNDGERDWSGFERVPLFRDPFAVFVPVNDPLTNKLGPITLADLDGREIARNQGLSGHAHRVAQACSYSGASVRFKMRPAASPAAFHIAEDNDVIIFSQSTASSLTSPPSITGLVQLPIDDPNAYYEFCVAWRKDAHNPGIQVVVDALAQAIGAIECDDIVKLPYAH